MVVERRDAEKSYDDGSFVRIDTNNARFGAPCASHSQGMAISMTLCCDTEIFRSFEPAFVRSGSPLQLDGVAEEEP